MPKAQEVRDTAPPAPVLAPVLAKDLTKEPLPPAIGSKTLVAAATSGDPAASYEIGSRLADGTGVPYRARTRPPSYIHFAMFPDLIVGHQLSDVVAVLGSLNIIAAELDR